MTKTNRLMLSRGEELLFILRIIFFFVAQQPNSGLGRLVFEVYTITDLRLRPQGHRDQL